MDAEILARLQFALTICFHYIYPPLSIGLGLIMVLIEGLYLKTGDPLYRVMAKFWTKVFALTFSLGVATGIVMEFEFGTNWAAYSRYVGDIFGSALGAEGVFAFFLESGFLALLLFGWDRVSKPLHFFSTCMVCLGAHFSAIWIVVANSWMQTPAGYHIVGEGTNVRAEITDFWQMVFNPSSVDRLTHTVLGAWLCAAFLVISVSAWYLLKQRHQLFAQRSLKIALNVALLTLGLQLLSGHSSAVGVAKNQPAKMAAFEGIYKTQEKAWLWLAGWVDNKAEKVYGIGIPGGASFLITGDASQPIDGLDKVKLEDRPPIQLSFQFYHLMLAMWGLMSAYALATFWRLRQQRLEQSPRLLKGLVFMVLAPLIANQAGWCAAEVGRQPWIVWHLLRTSEGLSKSVDAQLILTSLVMFTLIYILLFVLFIYLLDRKIKEGPGESVATEEYRDPTHLVRR
jgi:cytochrome d ubiquinol oxidase subunit I